MCLFNLENLTFVYESVQNQIEHDALIQCLLFLKVDNIILTKQKECYSVFLDFIVLILMYIRWYEGNSVLYKFLKFIE